MRLATTGLLLTLVGCAEADELSGPVPTPTQVSPSSNASAPMVWSDGSTTTPSPGHLELDAVSHREALELAELAMASFARPDLPYEAWWSDLQPLLSVGAAAAYVTVDPTNIPAREAGEASLPEWTTPEVARAVVSTDVGSYLVIMSRSEVDPVWRVERFVAPEVS